MIIHVEHFTVNILAQAVIHCLIINYDKNIQSLITLNDKKNVNEATALTNGKVPMAFQALVLLLAHEAINH